MLWLSITFLTPIFLFVLPHFGSVNCCLEAPLLCNTSSECCSKYCFAGYCCDEIGEICQWDEECCIGTCVTVEGHANGTCGCKRFGDACTYGVECCSSDCNGGICTCKTNDSPCLYNDECCSLHCNGYKCVGGIESGCPTGWTLNNGACYIGVPTSASRYGQGFNWMEAEAYCQKIGNGPANHDGHLASAHSTEDNTFLLSIRPNPQGSYWLGGYFIRAANNQLNPQSMDFTDGSPGWSWTAAGVPSSTFAGPNPFGAGWPDNNANQASCLYFEGTVWHDGWCHWSGGGLGAICQVCWEEVTKLFHLTHQFSVKTRPRKLLDNLLKDNPVSYMSARVLAHLISDSDEHWTKSGVTLSRDQVSVLIIQAIEKWDLHAPIHSYINYGFLKSTLRLLTQWHAIGSQHWAVWALANLTATDEKKKYCRMVAEEEGMKLLEQLKTDSRSTDAIRQLACTVIKNVEDWKNNSRDE